MASNSKKNEGYFKGFNYWFKKWITGGGSKTISILLTGKTGVGKSKLVNSLVGRTVAPEGKTKDPCTMKVDSYQTTMEGIDVIVWDSPGLQDGTKNEAEYIKDMSTRIKEVDLVIYCLRMDDSRLRDEDLESMRILTEVFGKKLWENAVFAFTFANKVEDPDAEDDSSAVEKKYFTEELREWEIALRKKLPLKAKIDLSVVERIPKVPIGTLKNLKLPDRENWLSDFWLECYSRMKVGCRVNLLRINRQRIKPEGKPAWFGDELLQEETTSKTEPRVLPFYSDQQRPQFEKPAFGQTTFQEEQRTCHLDSDQLRPIFEKLALEQTTFQAEQRGYPIDSYQQRRQFEKPKLGQTTFQAEQRGYPIDSYQQRRQFEKPTLGQTTFQEQQIVYRLDSDQQRRQFENPTLGQNTSQAQQRGYHIDHYQQKPQLEKPALRQTTSQAEQIGYPIGSYHQRPQLEKPTVWQTTSQAERVHNKSIESYPDLKFDSSQMSRLEQSTWDSFKDWVSDKWEGVKDFTYEAVKGCAYKAVAATPSNCSIS